MCCVFVAARRQIVSLEIQIAGGEAASTDCANCASLQASLDEAIASNQAQQIALTESSSALMSQSSLTSELQSEVGALQLELESVQQSADQNTDALQALSEYCVQLESKASAAVSGCFGTSQLAAAPSSSAQQQVQVNLSHLSAEHISQQQPTGVSQEQDLSGFEEIEAAAELQAEVQSGAAAAISGCFGAGQLVAQAASAQTSSFRECRIEAPIEKTGADDAPVHQPDGQLPPPEHTATMTNPNETQTVETAQREHLEQVVGGLQQRCAELEELLMGMTRQHESAQNDLVAAHADTSQYKAAVVALEQSLQSVSASGGVEVEEPRVVEMPENLEGQVLRLCAANLHLEETLTDLTMQLEEQSLQADQELEGAQAAIQTANAQMEVGKAEQLVVVAELGQLVKNENTAKIALIGELAAVQKELEVAQCGLVHVEGLSVGVISVARAVKRRLEECCTVEAALEKKLQSANACNNDDTAAAAALKTELGNARTEMVELQQTSDASAARVAELEAKTQAMPAQQQTAESNDIAKSKSKLKLAHCDSVTELSSPAPPAPSAPSATALAAKLGETQQELAVALDDCDNNSSRVEEYVALLQESQASNGTLNNQLTAVQSDLAAAHSQLKALRQASADKLTELEHRLTSAQDEQATTILALQAESSAHDTAKEKVVALEWELAVNVESLTTLETTHTRKDDIIRDLAEESQAIQRAKSLYASVELYVMELAAQMKDSLEESGMVRSQLTAVLEQERASALEHLEQLHDYKQSYKQSLEEKQQTALAENHAKIAELEQQLQHAGGAEKALQAQVGMLQVKLDAAGEKSSQIQRLEAENLDLKKQLVDVTVHHEQASLASEARVQDSRHQTEQVAPDRVTHQTTVIATSAVGGTVHGALNCFPDPLLPLRPFQI